MPLPIATPKAAARLLAPLLAAAAQAQDNILLVVVDDIGVDHVGIYAEHPNPGVTPVMDQLAARGLLFRNAWAHPGCTPSRASLITGRLPSRHGLGSTLSEDTPNGLPLFELTIPEMLSLGTNGAYTSFCVGKWHLAGSADAMTHPLEQGFAYHAGSKANIGDYGSWAKYINGNKSNCSAYATTDTTDEAIRQVVLTPEPWFGWVSYNAAHTPRHAPPKHLAPSFNLSGPPNQTPILHTKAMIEALDTELGRLLASIDPEVLSRTTIIFLSDNGTTAKAIDAPFDPQKGKGTAFEGGVNVPFFITGPHVAQPGTETSGLVMAVDVFGTIADIAGVDLDTLGVELDTISLMPYLANSGQPSLRDCVFTESFTPNGPGPYVRRWIGFRDARYKIVYLYQDIPTPEHQFFFFDLWRDPFEQDNLLEDVGPIATGFADLTRKLMALLASL